MITLPIDSFIPDILKALKEQDQLVLTASPGAGKTTRLPPELLKVVPGKIAVLEPRRMATVAACQRVADEQGWTVGQEVGYQVRFESRLAKNTRLVFMTDALLLRRLVDDSELNEFDLVVIDEFHERNLNQDLILGTLKELQELGRKIKILIMSATLDVHRLQRFLPQSQHIEVPGKVFPLEVRHSQQSMRISTDPDFIERVASATLNLARESAGDILVFLPGVGEIHRVQEALEQKKISRAIFPLHGSLTLNEQKNILKPHDEPRIILATNIAEASVTVPGVDAVIDTGLARIMEVNLNSGFSRLELSRIAKFNARQRAGRAARQKSGICLQLWTSHEDVAMNEEMVPECQRVDLAQTLLLLAHLGISDFSGFAWFDSPPSVLIKRATEYLRSTGALDEKNILSPLGKKLLSYPLPPRLGNLLAFAETNEEAHLAARSAALLQERDIVFSKSDSHSHLECDITYRLQLLEDVEKGRHVGGVNQRQAQAVLEGAEQLVKMIPKNNLKNTQRPEALRRLLLLTQSDRLSRRRGSGEKAIMVGGRGLRLAKESQVKTSEFFISLDGVDFPGQPDTTISLACGVTKQFVLETLKHQIHLHEDVYFDETKGQFYARRIRRFRDLDLDEPTLSPIRSEDLGERFLDVLVDRWEWLASQHEGLKTWLARWKFFTKLDPSLEEHLGKEQIRQALGFAVFEKTKVQDVLKEDLVRWIESSMNSTVIKQLHKELPTHFSAPSGVKHAIHYSETEDPYVEVRLQEMFGVTSTPKLGFGKLPLTFKLLAPNFRPVQVTSDIASFWKNIYFEVRKELRSRYPKHSWPEDPLTAPAVAKGRRRT